MKKVLSIVLLAVVTLASISLEATGRRKCNTGGHCCFPCVFSGAGTAVLGQLVNPNDPNAQPFLGFLGLNAQNYSRVKKCPIFEYNGIDPVTGQPFDQGGTIDESGSEAGIRQTIEGVTLFGGTLCLPDETQVCQHGGDLLNFPVAIDGLAIITDATNTTVSFISALDLAFAFSGASSFPPLPTSVVRADRSCTTYFLNQYLHNSFPGPIPPETFEWELGDNGSGPFDSNLWATALKGAAGDASNIIQVFGAEAVMKQVHMGTQDKHYIGYIAYSDFQRFKDTYTNVKVIAIQSFLFVSPSPETFTNAIKAVVPPVPADLLIQTNLSNNQVNSDTYPITFPINVVVRCCQFSKCQAIELRKFLYYLATAGQGTAEQFGLAPLTPEIVSQYIKNLNLLESSEDCIDTAVTKCCAC